MTAPRYYPCAADARLFPPEWRAIYFRQNSLVSETGLRIYSCPPCQRAFSAHDLDELQGDHIWPYALFGGTTWDNYQLLCGRCNRDKGAFLQTEIRTILGSAEFRALLGDFLRPRVRTRTESLRDMLTDP